MADSILEGEKGFLVVEGGSMWFYNTEPEAVAAAREMVARDGQPPSITAYVVSGTRFTAR